MRLRRSTKSPCARAPPPRGACGCRLKTATPAARITARCASKTSLTAAPSSHHGVHDHVRSQSTRRGPFPGNGSRSLSPGQACGSAAADFLISYPKIIFLYPTFLTGLIVSLYLSFQGGPLEVANSGAVMASTIFLGVLALNLVILAFDFPRTTSLTLFFFLVALVMGLVLLFVLKPDLLPRVTAFLLEFHPLANATFYWAFSLMLALIAVMAWIHARFDCWEARPNELLHHHGIWGNLERFSAPGLRVDKEINDVFEYLLLRSGRLILHPSSERRSIILDNIPFIGQKEAALTAHARRPAGRGSHRGRRDFLTCRPRSSDP